MRGIFGDPKARVITLNRRSKKGLRLLRSRPDGLVRPQGPPGARPARTAAIECDLTAALAIGIGARIHRIRQHMIDGDIAGVDPTDAAA